MFQVRHLKGWDAERSSSASACYVGGVDDSRENEGLREIIRDPIARQEDRAAVIKVLKICLRIDVLVIDAESVAAFLRSSPCECDLAFDHGKSSNLLAVLHTQRHEAQDDQRKPHVA